ARSHGRYGRRSGPPRRGNVERRALSLLLLLLLLFLFVCLRTETLMVDEDGETIAGRTGSAADRKGTILKDGWPFLQQARHSTSSSRFLHSEKWCCRVFVFSVRPDSRGRLLAFRSSLEHAYGMAASYGREEAEHGAGSS
ncbi:unnamed protein product, partial [Ectocarpus sp. 12 AP-2014]